MKTRWTKWLIAGMTIVLILGAAAGVLLALTHVDFVDTYGGLMDDGRFVYITIHADDTLETNLLDRPATGTYQIEQPLAQRLKKLRAGEPFAQISIYGHSISFFGYGTGLFRTNEDGAVELALEGGVLTKGVHNLKEYNYLQGRRYEKSDALRALSCYRNARGVQDADDRILKLAQRILRDCQDTDSERYASGQAMSDLLAIQDFVDAATIGPLLDIAYDHWLNDTPRALATLHQSTDTFLDEPDRMLKLTQRLLADYQDPESYCSTSHHVFLSLLSVYDRLSPGYADELMRVAYARWLEHCREPATAASPRIGTMDLGRFEQDGDTGNGPEKIEWWHVACLMNDPPVVMLMAKNALEYMPYHTGAAEVAWEESTLYQWLNGEFLQTAFTADEARMIAEVTVLSRQEIGEIITNYRTISQDEPYYGYTVAESSVSNYVYHKSERNRTNRNYQSLMAKVWLREGMYKWMDVYGNPVYEASEPGADHDVVPVLILKPAWE